MRIRTVQEAVVPEHLSKQCSSALNRNRIPLASSRTLYSVDPYLLKLKVIIIIIMCSYIYFCVSLYTRANFVIGLCAVTFARI
jgi:hypothetical protein